MRTAANDDQGFTLIETLVALTIFVACFILVHRSLSGNWQGVRVAQHLNPDRRAEDGEYDGGCKAK